MSYITLSFIVLFPLHTNVDFQFQIEMNHFKLEHFWWTALFLSLVSVLAESEREEAKVSSIACFCWLLKSPTVSNLSCKQPPITPVTSHTLGDYMDSKR